MKVVQFFPTLPDPWPIQSMEFSRPEYWSGQLFPSLEDLPNPGIEPRSLALQVDSLPAEGSPFKSKKVYTSRVCLIGYIWLASWQILPKV